MSGIPRVTRPRKRYGTVAGFSLIDVGGNWLRVSKAGDTEESAEHADSGLARIIEVAARLADAKGDDAGALKTLESGLRRFPRCSAYRSRPRRCSTGQSSPFRLGDEALARSSLDEVAQVELDMDERAFIAAELDHVSGLVDGG